MVDTLWVGSGNDKLYKNSGWSGTLKDSIDVSGVDTWPKDICRHSNGTDVLWPGTTNQRTYQSSGWSATIRDSIDYTSIWATGSVGGVGWELFTDLTMSEASTDEAAKCSGFSTTVKDSFDTPGSGPSGIEWYNGDTWLSDYQTNALYWFSGFSATVSDSLDIDAIDTEATGVTTDGSLNVMWCGFTNTALYKQSGWSTTLQDSFDMSGTDNRMDGIGYDFYAWWGRVGGSSQMRTVFNEPRKQANKIWNPAAPADVILYLLNTVAPIMTRNKPRRQRNAIWNPGVPLVAMGRRCMVARGRFRIAGDTGFWIYKNTVPTMPADPFDTTATLPYSPLATFGDGTHYIWMTYFDGFIESDPYPIGPRGEDYWRLDISGGVEVINPPAAPDSWELTPTAGGGCLVTATYYEEAGVIRATEFSMAVTFDGSDPTPGADDYNEAIDDDALAVLEYTGIPAQADGVTIKVILQMKRGTSFSENTTDIKTITADTIGPDAPEAADAWRGQIPEVS